MLLKHLPVFKDSNMQLHLSSSSFLLLVLCIFSAAKATDLLIHSSQGPIQGFLRMSRNGSPYLTFLGVPYAQPPVGPLRFKNPVKADPWDEIFFAQQLPNVCAQPEETSVILGGEYTIVGDEDCLYLNIFVPLNNYNEDYLPVLFYVHDGLMRFGNSGQTNVADYLMDEDVILVTCNYRLGILGLFSSEDDIIPGNFALKDQAMALNWVKENIASFGGNPDMITVLGYSTGAGCGQLLAMSPLTKNIVKGVISSSGSYSSKWILSNPGYGTSVAQKVATYFNCSESSDLLLSCLQSKDVTELLNLDKMFTVWDWDPTVIYRPVIEPDLPGAFLTEHPDSISHTFPMITGITSGEKNFRKMVLKYGDQTKMNTFMEEINTIIPTIFYVEPSSDYGKLLVDKIMDTFFTNTTSIDAIIDGFSDVFAESNIIYPMLRTVRMHQGPSYVYLFDHRGLYSMIDNILAEVDPGRLSYSMPEPSHADDQLYVMNNRLYPFSEQDYDISQTLIKLWTNFIKYQDPTPYNEFDRDLIWSPINDSDKYLRINSIKISLEDRRNDWDKMEAFWDSLLTFPQ